MIIFELSLPPSQVQVSTFISEHRVEKGGQGRSHWGSVKPARLGKTSQDHFCTITAVIRLSVRCMLITKMQPGIPYAKTPPLQHCTHTPLFPTLSQSDPILCNYSWTLRRIKGSGAQTDHLHINHVSLQIIPNYHYIKK